MYFVHMLMGETEYSPQQLAESGSANELVFEIKLWKRVFLGLALGVAFGLAAVQFLGAERGEKRSLRILKSLAIFLSQ